MQRYLVSLFAINGSLRKVLKKGSVQEMWEDARVWEDDVCGFVLTPSLAFDIGRKRGLCHRVLVGNWCYHLEVGSPCLTFFCKLDDQYASAVVSLFLKDLSACYLQVTDKDVVIVFTQLTRVWKSYL